MQGGRRLLLHSLRMAPQVGKGSTPKATEGGPQTTVPPPGWLPFPSRVERSTRQENEGASAPARSPGRRRRRRCCSGGRSTGSRRRWWPAGPAQRMANATKTNGKQALPPCRKAQRWWVWERPRRTTPPCAPAVWLPRQRARTCSDASMSVALPQRPVASPGAHPCHRLPTPRMPDDATEPQKPGLRVATVHAGRAAPPSLLPLPRERHVGNARAAAVLLGCEANPSVQLLVAGSYTAAPQPTVPRQASTHVAGLGWLDWAPAGSACSCARLLALAVPACHCEPLASGNGTTTGTASRRHDRCGQGRRVATRWDQQARCFVLRGQLRQGVRNTRRRRLAHRRWRRSGRGRACTG